MPLAAPPSTPARTIKLHLLDRGQTVAQLAEAIDASRSLVSQVIHGHLQTPAIRRAIAAELGMSFQELWGVEDPGVDHLTPGRKRLTPVNHSGELAVDAGVVDAG